MSPTGMFPIVLAVFASRFCLICGAKERKFDVVEASVAEFDELGPLALKAIESLHKSTPVMIFAMGHIEDENDENPTFQVVYSTLKQPYEWCDMDLSIDKKLGKFSIVRLPWCKAPSGYPDQRLLFADQELLKSRLAFIELLNEFQ